jgi:hypothetical protein
MAARVTDNPWLIVSILGALIVLFLALRVVFPRYDWHPVGDGHAIIIYDKWTGRFQRAEWSADGKLQLMDVYTAP